MKEQESSMFGSIGGAIRRAVTPILGNFLQAEEESDDDSHADDYCFRCGQRGHWAQDCGQPYSYYGYGRY